MEAGCAAESLKQHGRPLTCLISSQSFSIEDRGGKVYGLFSRQSGDKRALNHSFIASSGGGVLL